MIFWDISSFYLISNPLCNISNTHYDLSEILNALEYLNKYSEAIDWSLSNNKPKNLMCHWTMAGERKYYIIQFNFGPAYILLFSFYKDAFYLLLVISLSRICCILLTRVCWLMLLNTWDLNLYTYYDNVQTFMSEESRNNDALNIFRFIEGLQAVNKYYVHF